MDGVQCFFDDILVQGSTYEETLLRLEKVLEVLQKHNLHLNGDKFERRHECLACGKKYVQKGHLTRHLKYECGVDPQFACVYCKYKSKHKQTLEVHMALKHGQKIDVSTESADRRHECFACGKKYVQKSHLTRHLKYECGVDPQFACPTGDMSALPVVRSTFRKVILPDISSYLQFLSKFFCDICGRSYKHKFLLGRHKKFECGKQPQFAYFDVTRMIMQELHASEDVRKFACSEGDNNLRFGCDTCSRSYKYHRDLLRHKRYECGIAPQFACPLCPYKAKLRKTLRNHMIFKHPTNDELVCCSMGKATSVSDVMLVEGSTSIDVIWHVTSVTSVGFLHSMEIQKLLEAATAMERFCCTFCGKVYRHKCDLKRHQRYECGKDPTFCCPHCPYKAKQKGTLKTHIINTFTPAPRVDVPTNVAVRCFVIRTTSAKRNPSFNANIALTAANTSKDYRHTMRELRAQIRKPPIACEAPALRMQ
ncbi:zinc finger protein 649-like [Macrosteles quadrilineatus]|uniref:zinc finger protein 649-like n=1 Tax=Macrosteles quadrilineatus TaxID=74068 RepID=UPI0023E1ECEE|nr:zinc finger protein 649-like [Macrosteles quadrilineatus]